MTAVSVSTSLTRRNMKRACGMKRLGLDLHAFSRTYRPIAPVMGSNANH